MLEKKKLPYLQALAFTGEKKKKEFLLYDLSLWVIHSVLKQPHSFFAALPSYLSEQ